MVNLKTEISGEQLPVLTHNQRNMRTKATTLICHVSVALNGSEIARSLSAPARRGSGKARHSSARVRSQNDEKFISRYSYFPPKYQPLSRGNGPSHKNSFIYAHAVNIKGCLFYLSSAISTFRRHNESKARLRENSLIVEERSISRLT